MVDKHNYGLNSSQQDDEYDEDMNCCVKCCIAIEKKSEACTVRLAGYFGIQDLIET